MACASYDIFDTPPSVALLSPRKSPTQLTQTKTCKTVKNGDVNTDATSHYCRTNSQRWNEGNVHCECPNPKANKIWPYKCNGYWNRDPAPGDVLSKCKEDNCEKVHTCTNDANDAYDCVDQTDCNDASNNNIGYTCTGGLCIYTDFLEMGDTGDDEYYDQEALDG